MPLSEAQRRRIPKSQFVFPKERKYPINTLKHAKSALSLAALHGAQLGGAKGRALIDKVYGAVVRKYPALSESDSKTMRAFLRRKGRKNPPRKKASTQRKLVVTPESTEELFERIRDTRQPAQNTILAMAILNFGEKRLWVTVEKS